MHSNTVLFTPCPRVKVCGDDSIERGLRTEPEASRAMGRGSGPHGEGTRSGKRGHAVRRMLAIAGGLLGVANTR